MPVGCTSLPRPQSNAQIAPDTPQSISDLQLTFALEPGEEVEDPGVGLTLNTEQEDSDLSCRRSGYLRFPLSLLSSSLIFSPPRATDSKPSAVSPHCALAAEGRLKFKRRRRWWWWWWWKRRKRRGVMGANKQLQVAAPTPNR